MAPADTATTSVELRDVHPGRIYFWGAVLLAILVVSLTGLWLVFHQTSGPGIGFMRPDPAADLAAFEAAETKKLNTLAWVDRKAGIARIPVDDAMVLIAQRGKLPEWPQAQPADQECTFLEGAVPRSPAAIRCATGWSQWLGKAP